MGCESFSEATAAVFRMWSGVYISRTREARRRLGTKKMREALWDASRDAESLDVRVRLFLEMQWSR